MTNGKWKMFFKTYQRAFPTKYLLAVMALYSLPITGVIGCRPATLAKKQSTQAHDGRINERPPLKLPLKDPRIVVLKSKRQLELYSDGAVVRTYPIGLGLNPVDDKKREGDRCTPEGDFYVFVKNPKSAYYLSLGISYPSIEDAERGLRTV